MVQIWVDPQAKVHPITKINPISKEPTARPWANPLYLANFWWSQDPRPTPSEAAPSKTSIAPEYHGSLPIRPTKFMVCVVWYCWNSVSTIYSP